VAPGQTQKMKIGIIGKLISSVPIFFAWSPNVFWKGKFLVNVSAMTEDYHSLEGAVTLNKNVSGMFALTSRSSVGNRQNKAEKYFIAYEKNNFLLKSFYNLRLIQSADPMRLLKADSIPLRQDEIVFYGEKNPNENYGLGKQGILARLGPAEVFIADDYLTEEDLIFAQAGFKGINAEYISKRGRDFPFASGGHWFPDPEQLPTWQGNRSVQPWYKGFNEENEFSLYGSAEKNKAGFFWQWSVKNKLLRALIDNRSGSGDIDVNKKWHFYNARKYMAGAKYGGPLAAEVSYFLENGKFEIFWNCRPRVEERKIILRWKVNESYIGAEARNRSMRPLAEYNVYKVFDPYYIRYYFDSGKRYYRWKEYRLIGKLKGASREIKFTGKMYPEEKLKEAVICGEQRISVFALRFSPRYFSYESKNYLSYSASAGWKKGALSIEAGSGLSPESLSLWDENDRREDFLYNSAGFREGEELLKKEELWLRIVLSF